MGGLLGDIVSMCTVRIFPGAGVGFSKYGIQRLLDTTIIHSSAERVRDRSIERQDVRRFDVPSAKIELDNRDEAFERVIVLGHRK
jgi:hypothetical protein